MAAPLKKCIKCVKETDTYNDFTVSKISTSICKRKIIKHSLKHQRWI